MKRAVTDDAGGAGNLGGDEDPGGIDGEEKLKIERNGDAVAVRGVRCNGWKNGAALRGESR